MLQEQAKYGTHGLTYLHFLPFLSKHAICTITVITVILRHNLGKLSPLNTSQSVAPWTTSLSFSADHVKKFREITELSNLPWQIFTKVYKYQTDIRGREFLDNCSNKFKEDREDSFRRRKKTKQKNQFWLIVFAAGWTVDFQFVLWVSRYKCCVLCCYISVSVWRLIVQTKNSTFLQIQLSY